MTTELGKSKKDVASLLDICRALRMRLQLIGGSISAVNDANNSFIENRTAVKRKALVEALGLMVVLNESPSPSLDALSEFEDDAAKPGDG